MTASLTVQLLTRTSPLLSGVMTGLRRQTNRAHMLPFSGTLPAGFNRCPQLAFEPRSAIADTPTGTVFKARCTAKLDRSQSLGIANVAKNKFSYAHGVWFKNSGLGFKW